MGTIITVPIIDHAIYIGLPCSERKMLYECWNKGRVDIAPISHADIRYTLSYIDKQIFGANQLYQEFGDFEPPFAHFSKGLGVQWIEQNIDKFDETGTINWTDKKSYTLPPYFRDKYGFIKLHHYFSNAVKKYASDNHINDLFEAEKIYKKLKEQSMIHKEIQRFGTKIDLHKDELYQAYNSVNNLT